jgi:hypothetical protein
VVTGQVQRTSLESSVKPLEAGPRLDKSDGALWSPADKALESGLRPSKSDRPDKSGGALWSSVQCIWNPVDLPDKSGET